MPTARSLRTRTTKRSTGRPFLPACVAGARPALAAAWDDRNVAGLELLSAGWEPDKLVGGGNLRL